MTDNQTLPLLSPVEASAFLFATKGLRVAPATLAKRRCLGGGPIFQKFGARRVVYRPADLASWADAVLGAPRHNTSEV